MAIRGKEAEQILKRSIASTGKLKTAQLYYGSGKSKYSNEKVTLDGIRFDSRKEASRYAELKYLLLSGEIGGLELQRVFELIPAQKDARGKVIERAITYRADFYYFDVRKGVYVVEDTKGMRTDVYKLKKKLMRYMHGIEIIER